MYKLRWFENQHHHHLPHPLSQEATHGKKQKLCGTKAEAKQTEFMSEVKPHLAILENYARQLTRNQDDAQDLLQETMLKAFRFWDKYELGTNIRAWLFRIMKNSYINRYRKETKEPEKVDYGKIENYHWLLLPHNDSCDSDPEKEMYARLLSDGLTSALETTSTIFRTVVILIDIEGMTYEEASSMLRCPIGTIRSRLYRGRRTIRKHLLAHEVKRAM